MIKVFSGKWRGLGGSQDGLGMLIDFKFREILCKFSGAKLAVFMCIALHSDQEGQSFPSINTISRKTGYATSTVSEALNDLCKLTIDGYRVLARTSRTKKDGSNTSNLYIIFPSENELSEIGPSPIPDIGISPIPKTGVPPIPETDIPPIPDSDIPPIPEIGNEDIPLNLKDNHSLSLAEASEKSKPSEKPVQRTMAQKKGDLVDGALAYSRNLNDPDVSTYPEELQPILKEFCRLWALTPPRQDGKGGQYALWIMQGRSLKDALAEFGATALPAVYDAWRKFKYDVGRPGAILTTARATAGKLRSEARDAAPVIKGIDPEEVERQREQLRKQKEMRANGQSDGSIENWLARAEARHSQPAEA
jgi:hypothetical protein